MMKFVLFGAFSNTSLYKYFTRLDETIRGSFWNFIDNRNLLTENIRAYEL